MVGPFSLFYRFAKFMTTCGGEIFEKAKNSPVYMIMAMFFRQSDYIGPVTLYLQVTFFIEWITLLINHHFAHFCG